MIEPLFDKVLIEPKKADEMVGGIFIPEAVREKKPTEGTVIAVGPGKPDGSKMTVKVGDHVLYSKYGGSDIMIDGKDYVIIEEGQIYGRRNGTK